MSGHFKIVGLGSTVRYTTQNRRTILSLVIISFTQFPSLYNSAASISFSYSLFDGCRRRGGHWFLVFHWAVSSSLPIVCSSRRRRVANMAGQADKKRAKQAETNTPYYQYSMMIVNAIYLIVMLLDYESITTWLALEAAFFCGVFLLAGRGTGFFFSIQFQRWTQ